MKERLLIFLSLALVCLESICAECKKQTDSIGIPDNYREILSIRITDIAKSCHISADDGMSVSLLSFGGSCDNEFFKGTVLPGGYDCQLTEGSQTTLSARYVMEGVDSAGDCCKIFIENNATAGSKLSKPKIITDSRTLSFLNTSELIGFLDDSGPFTIRIFAPCE